MWKIECSIKGKISCRKYNNKCVKVFYIEIFSGIDYLIEYEGLRAKNKKKNKVNLEPEQTRKI